MHNRIVRRIPAKLYVQENYEVGVILGGIFIYHRRNISNISSPVLLSRLSPLTLFWAVSNSEGKPNSGFSIASPQISGGREK